MGVLDVILRKTRIERLDHHAHRMDDSIDVKVAVHWSVGAVLISLS